jgi:hypothetical protein
MNFFKREDGNVVVIVAISMMVLIAFAALGVDGGYLFYRHTQLQDYADTFTLAAGRDYNGTDLSTAIAAVKSSAENNGFTWTADAGHAGRITNSNGESGVVDVLSPENGSIKVDLLVDYNLSFSQAAFGKSSAPVAASAKVAKQMLSAYGKGLYPIGIVQKSTFVKNTQYTLTFDPGNTEVGGNFGYVNLDSYLAPGVGGNNPAGDSNFDTYLALGYSGTDPSVFYVGGTLNTITGAKVGIANQALSSIKLNQPSTWKTIMIPIIDQYGNDRVHILGFGKFRIEDFDQSGQNKKISGRFIEDTKMGQGTTNETGLVNYTSQTLHLVQ